MATKTCQPQASPAVPAVAVRAAAATAGNGRVSAGTLLPPPRRGQIKEKIVKDLVAAVVALAKNSRGGVPVPATATATANKN